MVQNIKMTAQTPTKLDFSKGPSNDDAPNFDLRMFIGMLRDGQTLFVCYIDPGRALAIRFESLHMAANGDIYRSQFKQYFFRLDLDTRKIGSGLDSTTMAMAKHMTSDVPELRNTHIYFIENQFELSVARNYGAIAGVIATIRVGDVSYGPSSNRRGAANVVTTKPYAIVPIGGYVRVNYLKTVAPDFWIKGQKRTPAELKELVIKIANMVLTSMGDTDTLDMLDATKKQDDIADTVCFADAVYYQFVEQANPQKSTSTKAVRKSK
jgi:hypothetical protein